MIAGWVPSINSVPRIDLALLRAEKAAVFCVGRPTGTRRKSAARRVFVEHDLE